MTQYKFLYVHKEYIQLYYYTIIILLYIHIYYPIKKGDLCRGIDIVYYIMSSAVLIPREFCLIPPPQKKRRILTHFKNVLFQMYKMHSIMQV